MPSQFWESSLNSPSIGAGTALANSAVATDISPAPQYVMPANTMYVGQRWRLTAYGIYSTAASANPTLTVGFYYGGIAGTALVTSGAITVTVSAASWPVRCVMDMNVRTIGSSGTVWCSGLVYNPTSLTAITTQWMPATQTQPITINTTTANALTFGATWSSAVAGTTITCEEMIVELLN